jgi:hypothetical protein
MRRLPLAGAAALVFALFSGCGQSAGDVLAFEVTGGPLPAKQVLVVTLDGRGSCNRGKLREIPNSDLIDAQAVARDAKPLAEAGASFSGARRPGARQYLLRLPQGNVAWSEGQPGIPPALARSQVLALHLGRTLCGRA